MTLPQFPITLTKRDRNTFDKFFLSLDEPDRQALSDLFARARQHIPAVDHSGHPLPYQVWLMALTLEEHQELLRLHQIVEGDFY
jgi:hypothetical protein